MSKKVLEISGVSVEQLANACGTPLYVYDENKITQKMSQFHELFQSEDVWMSSAAASCLRPCRQASQWKRFIFTATIKHGMS